jgi:hypothetical protein
VSSGRYPARWVAEARASHVVAATAD